MGTIQCKLVNYEKNNLISLILTHLKYGLKPYKVIDTHKTLPYNLYDLDTLNGIYKYEGGIPIMKMCLAAC